MTTSRRLVLLVSCWVALPLGILAAMWSIALRGQLGQAWPTVEVHRPALLVLGCCLLALAVTGTTWVLLPQRWN